jgi:hypothetical protein
LTVETLPVLPEIGEQFLMSTTNWDVVGVGESGDSDDDIDSDEDDIEL